MKRILATTLLLANTATLAIGASTGTAFTYQGRLTDSTNAVGGIYDLRFTLYDGPVLGRVIAGPITNIAVRVSNGLFTTSLDFDDVFNGGKLWLQTAVRTNGNGGFTVLSPRQELTPVPYAHYAPSAGVAALASAVVAGGITSDMLANGAVTTDKIGARSVTSMKIDDGGSGAYADFLTAAGSVSDSDFVPFHNLFLVSSNTGAAPSFSFALNGTGLGTVVGFVGHEGISQPFEFVVGVAATSGALVPDEAIGRQGRLTFTRNGQVTSFAGAVTACAVSSQGGTNGLYTFRLEPVLSYLGLKTDYAVNQNATVPALVSSLYQTITGDTLSSSLIETHDPRDCVIQFGETALNFTSRLLEEEGIFYFFQHGGGAPALRLGDANGVFPAAPYSSLRYFGDQAEGVPAGTEYVRTFQKSGRDSVRVARIRNYDFEKPATVGEAMADAGIGQGEHHEYGSPWTAAGDLDSQATRRMERQHLERSTMSGTANAAGLRAGYIFGLEDATGTGASGNYLLTAVRHAGFRRVTNGVATLFYGNAFEATPAATAYRPTPKTPRPVAQPCTAIVTGPVGEEIHVDKYGRVKVQFHWDRYGNKNDQSSAWVRVANPWAGQGRGAVFLPRVGDEVLVSFLQGNPDQPVVTGSLFNGANVLPYALPASKTVSTIKTKSSKGGAKANEIKFDDLAGSELLAITAAKDLQVSASNDVTVSVGAKMFVQAAQGVTITASTAPALNVSGALAATSFQGSGAGLTSLPATGLTGTVADARLSSNVALRNGGNVFTGEQVIVSGGLRLADLGIFFRGGSDMNHGIGWFPTGSFAGANPDGPILFGCAGGGLGSLCGTPVLALAWTSQGNVVLDPAGLNSGALTPGLTFGPSGKEGIGSSRSGSINVFGLDFYTGGTNRMSLTSSGNLGIGTTAPTRRVQIVDADGLSGSLQIGTAVASANSKLINFGDGDYVHIGETGVDDRLELKGTSVYINSSRVGIGNTNPTNLLMVGTARCDGVTWINSSDRNAKENLQPVDSRELLAKVAELPISRWSYKNSDGSTHLGPMAQDFRSAFGLGADDTSISTVDADGVALAAIQGLNEALKEKDDEIRALKQRLERLERLLPERN